MKPIFSEERWHSIIENSDKWWEHKLGRPLIQVKLSGLEIDMPKPQTPFYEIASLYDLSVPVEEIIDVWDYQLRTIEYLGDAYPNFNPNFGAGAIAAFLGARLENGIETVWFHPEKMCSMNELELKYLSENKWFKRTKELIAAADERWQGGVQVNLTDLGGNMDILLSFRQSENLILDLFDVPERVEEMTWVTHDLWWRYFNELTAITKHNKGYSSWAEVFSTKSHYMLQCDFCFMISPDMFERFARPELVATSEKMERAFYHLDGPGELNHLDSILAIDSIKGIQWVAGAGQPDITHWPEVLKKITNAGKLLHVASNMADDPYTVIDTIADITGTAENIVYTLYDNVENRDKAIKVVEKYC